MNRNKEKGRLTILRERAEIAWLTFSRRLCVIAFCLMFLSLSHSAVAAGMASDEFMSGYVTSILERDLHWEQDTYALKIFNGVATITLFEDDPLRREAIDKQLRAIDRLEEITVVVKAVGYTTSRAASSFMGITRQAETFPTGDLFQPLIADPKQARFFATLRDFRSLEKQYTMATVGFGETFGFYRYFGIRKGDGLQLSVVGALFAQFNMDSASSDLINADYTIGIPVTYRYSDNSLRFRIYHQSSHLGDELLLGANPPERVNLSYEALEFIYSREWRGFRVYGGGEYLVHKEPSDLKPLSTHWGLEYRGSTELVWGGRPIAGIDMKNLAEHDWANDCSVKAGLEFGNPNPGQRHFRLMSEWYRGFDPHGQFYINKVEYYGLGVSLGF